jgi:hypothetical protein
MSTIETGIEQFTKKPVTIEATQWDGTVEDATRVINWILRREGTASYHESFDTSGEDAIYIRTLEGTMKALVGYYIIRGIEGEFYPCEPAIFHRSYDADESKLSKILQEFDGIVKLSVATLGNPHQVLIRNLLNKQINKVVAEMRNEEV